MIGSFTPGSGDTWTDMRRKLLDGRRTLPAPDDLSAERVVWSDVVADDLLRQLSADGLGVVTLAEPLPADDFIAFGHRLGRITEETDPAVRRYVEGGVILNLISGLPRDVDVSLQPFSVSSLTLHSEGSGRALADQPRYIVLMCSDPGGDGAAAQTVLVPMATVADRMDPAHLALLERTRYHGRTGVPTVARRIGERVAFSFRDFQDDTLKWECDAQGVGEADVNRALTGLLTAMYDPHAALGLDWSRGRLVVIDNTYLFHGRTAGSLGSGARRHLKRLRILPPAREVAA